ncbi:hypothetical protein NC651_012417 [Populus alba x Populus x berolinensis]|nr:hypothetical protein NC651_012417 [Populus alba x Populus x berolinensis]
MACQKKPCPNWFEATLKETRHCQAMSLTWLKPCWIRLGTLVVLDARTDGIIYRDLIPEYGLLIVY